MANIKSAVKRIKITERNTLENKLNKSNIKTFTKKYLVSLNDYKEKPNPTTLAIANQNLSLVFSKIDKATKKKVLHKNTAARKKSMLANAFNFVRATV
jgi:small subunit ribosomal protein S20